MQHIYFASSNSQLILAELRDSQPEPHIKIMAWQGGTYFRVRVEVYKDCQ